MNVYPSPSSVLKESFGSEESNFGNIGNIGNVSGYSHSASASPPVVSPTPSTQLSRAQIVLAEALAMKMQEDERKKRDEKKRKRETEEQSMRLMRSKVDGERKRVEEEDEVSFVTNRELYKLFNDLQGIAHDFNLSFETPELVVVGMQSDGKSSFIEALLGFQFNIVESNIGTRRPLILQMINNPSKPTPCCRFRKESVSSNQDPFEERETPVPDLTDEIVRRTNQVAGRGDTVSSSPIILKVEYCHCSNLNIYDTPGFRLGGDEALKNEILAMVRALIEPSHRIIVCLEQSTVEWSNSVSRPLVRQVDPNFSRTILVNTKFDNRVKELRSAESADKYLVGENLPAGKKPFFISLPLRRTIGADSKRFKEAIKECYIKDYENLLSVDFDEKSFLPQIGFPRTKIYLEKLLNEKYHNALHPTLRSLESLCSNTEHEITTIKGEIENNNIQLLRPKAQRFVQAFISQIEKLLEGDIVGDPDVFGETLSEEKIRCGIQDWPDFNLSFEIQNQNFKLYGGSQYERLLNEFEYVAHSKEFPKTSMNEVASALGAAKSHNVPVFETAASNIVQNKARKALQPLLEVVLGRCSYIMRRLFEIALEILKKEGGMKKESGIAVLGFYERFLEELRNTYFRFIVRTEENCRQKLQDDFASFTKILDWDLVRGLTEIKDYNYLKVTPEETKQRVQAIMEQKCSNSENFVAERSLSRRIGEDVYEKVCSLSGRLFSGIRYFLAKYIRNKLNAFFLDPMFQTLGGELTDHFCAISDNKYEEMFTAGVGEMKAKLSTLENLLVQSKANRDRFKDVYLKMKKASENVKK